MDKNKKISIEFDMNELNLVFEGLGELPAKKSHSLMGKIEQSVYLAHQESQVKQQESGLSEYTEK